MAETPEEVATCRVCWRGKADENTDRADYTPYPDPAGPPDAMCWAYVFLDGADQCYRLGYERLLYALGPALRAQYVAGLEAALEVVDRWSGPTAYHIERDIRELAEQAKRG